MVVYNVFMVIAALNRKPHRREQKKRSGFAIYTSYRPTAVGTE
jgi:hypothetical protein